MPESFFRPSPPAEPDAPQPPLARKLGWFVLLCAGGLVCTAGVAYFLRALLFIG